MRRVIFHFLFSPNEKRAGGAGWGDTARLFLFFFLPCSVDHERDWPPCKVFFFGLATKAMNVRNNSSEGLGAFRFFFKQQFLLRGVRVFKRRIRAHLDLLSIPQSGGEIFKTFRWDQRLQIRVLVLFVLFVLRGLLHQVI